MQETNNNVKTETKVEKPIKPISVVIQEFKVKLNDLVKDADIPVVILEGLVKDFYLGIKEISDGYSRQETANYEQKMKEYEKSIKE